MTNSEQNAQIQNPLLIQIAEQFSLRFLEELVILKIQFSCARFLTKSLEHLLYLLNAILIALRKTQKKLVSSIYRIIRSLWEWFEISIEFIRMIDSSIMDWDCYWKGDFVPEKIFSIKVIV